MKRKLLVIDHSAVVDLYRERERVLAKEYNYNVSMVIPNYWNEGSINVFLNNNDIFKIYNSKTLFTNRVPLFIYNPFTLIKAMINEKPDIIDIHEEPYSLAAIEVILLKKIFSSKSKVVFYSAQNILKKYPLPIRFFERIVCKNSHAAYTCSSEVTSVLRRRSFNGDITEIPLGIDEKIFFPRYYKRVDKFVFGFVGRIEKSKGILDLINALSLMESNNWECLIIGEGSLSEESKKLILEKKLEKKIKLIGSVEAEEIPDYLNQIDALVVPSITTKSWKEQFGRVIVEAFACGKPVIGSSSGAIPEVISDGGIIFTEGNVEELRLSLDNIITNKKLYKKISENALKRSKLYSWMEIAKQFDRIYKKLIK